MSRDQRKPIRVVLADDQALVRTGFRLVLELDDHIQVVGEAVDGAQAIDLARRLRPDVVLMDIRMPILDGVEATREITAHSPDGRPWVVVLTTYELDDYIFDALQAGAIGFLLKEVEPDELRRSVHAAAAGGSLLSPSVARRVVERFAQRPDARPKDPERLERLTDREREVMALVAQGLTNEQIGEQLHMSPATAKTHISRAMMKLHARDRAHLVVIAYETGLVEGRSTP